MLNKEESINRFITFHRYGINANNWRIGFAEAIIGTYENWGASEPGYLMPAAVLLETEENRGINANLMWLIDGMYKCEKWTFYSELLIDDFAVDGKSPPEIGGVLGFCRKFNKFLLNMEYTQINRWTGNYCDSLHLMAEINASDTLATPLGHSLGSDAHMLYISVFIPFKKTMGIDVSLKWIESGAGGGKRAKQREMLHNFPRIIKDMIPSTG